MFCMRQDLNTDTQDVRNPSGVNFRHRIFKTDNKVFHLIPESATKQHEKDKAH